VIRCRDTRIRRPPRTTDGRGPAATLAGVTTDRHARHQRSPVDPRRRPVDGFRPLRPGAFERMVEDALSSLPPDLLAYVDNVQIVIEDVPPPDALGDGEDGILLGLYEGVPRTERSFDAPPVLPDRITLFRKPLEARCRSRSELALVVQETVVHEIAHHFGIDDDRLDELGWG
jgi:predicted Zn-dependent protease with MMP-like domain